MLNKSSLSPRDSEGHGTHTLSTAGGSFVKGVDVYGYGYGVAKGGSPNARVAAYKVCWHSQSCMTADIMAAVEAAIDDGVDVLSVSLNDAVEVDYKEDGLAIASFHASVHGILVVNSAGNFGPEPRTIKSLAPWIFSIGASTIDRNFFNEVYLRNSSLYFKGAYLGPEKMRPTKHFFPLIVAASAVASSSTVDKARYCEENSLDSKKVNGKIVICDYPGISLLNNGKVVREAGGVGMLIISPKIAGSLKAAEPHYIPASHLTYQDGQAILDYINKTENPAAYITDIITVSGIKPAPVVAELSSRGPSVLYPHILKPDVIAPGVDIIAAFSGALGPAANDTRRVKYYSLSGTSMSCPHVAGVVALLKSMHPDWSPAAIRSALMTTATTFDNDNNTILDYDQQQPATPFALGAGHIKPNLAADPGLIYNLTEQDYLDYLCSIGTYTEHDLQAFTQNPYKCPNSKRILDFNYPSIVVSNFTIFATFNRTLTNVGNPGSYDVMITSPSGVNVTVTPPKLKFSRTGEEQTFGVELKANGQHYEKAKYVFGSLVWSDGNHNVRSPLVVERV